MCGLRHHDDIVAVAATDSIQDGVAGPCPRFGQWHHASQETVFRVQFRV
jgi:hypothetical protein